MPIVEIYNRQLHFVYNHTSNPRVVVPPSLPLLCIYDGIYRAYLIGGLLQHALHVRYDIYNNKHRENIHQHLFSTSTFVQTYKFLMFHTTITSKRQNYGMNDLQQCIWCIGSYMHARSSSIQKYVGSIFYFNSVSIGMVGYHYYVHTIQKIRNYVQHISLLLVTLDRYIQTAAWDDWGRWSIHTHQTIKWVGYLVR